MDVSYNLLYKERSAIRKSPKMTTQSLKTEPRIIKETGSFFAKYTCVKMASRKIQAYQNKARNLRTIYFFCLTSMVNANSLKQNIIVIKEQCSS